MNLDTQVSNECTAIELPLNLHTQCIPPTAPHRTAPHRTVPCRTAPTPTPTPRPGPARLGEASERARARVAPQSPFSNFAEGVH